MPMIVYLTDVTLDIGPTHIVSQTVDFGQAELCPEGHLSRILEA